MRVDPRSLPRRTPLRKAFETAGASWRSLGEAAIAQTVPQSPDPRALRLSISHPSPASASRDAAPCPPCRPAVSRSKPRPTRHTFRRTEAFVSSWRRPRSSCFRTSRAKARGSPSSRAAGGSRTRSALTLCPGETVTRLVPRHRRHGLDNVRKDLRHRSQS